MIFSHFRGYLALVLGDPNEPWETPNPASPSSRREKEVVLEATDAL